MSASLVLVVTFIVCNHHVIGIPLANFYPFGNTIGDSAVPRTLDGPSGPVNLSTPFIFFGQIRELIFVNNNGLISFQMPFDGYIPEAFPLLNFYLNRQLIAPYWADADTRDDGSGTVWYRETDEFVLLARAADDIQAAFISESTFFPAQLFIATWERVRSYASFFQNTDLRNTFQCVMATDGNSSFVTFLYADGEIQWTITDVIGVFGGIDALAGINAGDGVRFTTIPGSLTPEIINITTTTNVGIPGVWIFRVDQENITNGGCSMEPIAQNTCESGGTCQFEADSFSFSCECPPGFTGVLCESDIVPVLITLEQISFAVREDIASENQALLICAVAEAFNENAANVTVTLSTESDSAQDGNDFLGVAQEMVFVPSDDIMHLCGCVELIDDLIPEDTETFFIRLNTTDSGVEFRIQTSTVTIIDDDPLDSLCTPLLRASHVNGTTGLSGDVLVSSSVCRRLHP